MNKLIVRPLKEGRIHREIRLFAAYGKPCRHTESVSFSNADVGKSFGETLSEFVKSGT